VLGVDVVIAEALRLPQRQLEHLLRPRRERNLTCGQLVTFADDQRHLPAYLRQGNVERGEYASRDRLRVAKQTK
jgi:hypothetical protein